MIAIMSSDDEDDHHFDDAHFDHVVIFLKICFLLSRPFDQIQLTLNKSIGLYKYYK